MKIFKIATLIFIPFLLSHCGDDQNFDVEIQIVPETALLVPGEGPNCTDLTESIVDRPNSVKPYSINFASFRLRWTSTTEDLFISEVRVRTPEGDPNIDDYSYSIIGTELDVMLGLVGGRVPAALTTVSCDDGNIVGCREILSNVNSTKPSPLIECGLRFGGIPVDDIDSRFTTTATVTVIGFSVNLEDGTQRPQRDTFNITIQKE